MRPCLTALFGHLVLAALALLGCAGCADRAHDVACAQREDCPAQQVCFEGACVPPRCGEAGACPTADAGASDATAGGCVEGQTQPCNTPCGAGLATCHAGAFVCGPDPAGPRPTELCGDALDNDCDGQIDEDCAGCAEGDVRDCATLCGPGRERCSGGTWRACSAARPRPEICGDGLDQDCDGELDEGCTGCVDGDARACETICGRGTEHCVAGLWQGCDAPAPTPEICDAIDNDCDGTIDNDVVRSCDDRCGPGTQTCALGAFGPCTAPEICGCTGAETDEQICGQCGSRSRTCDGAAWGPWSPCTEGTSGTCQPGETIEARCERCGTRLKTCGPACEWGGFEPCIGQGACEPGQIDTQPCPGGCGTHSRVCGASCAWGDFGPCTVEAVAQTCAAGDVDVAPCGNRCGSHRRSCTGQCAWSPWEACQDAGDCSPGAEEVEPCEGDGTRIRTCDDACKWGDFGACEVAPQCNVGQTDARACGLCGEQLRTCKDNRRWGEWGTCQDQGECAPGDADVRACGSNVGECHTGTDTFRCDSACTWRSSGTCAGSVAPATEVCGNSTDEDCDGEAARAPDAFEPNDACGACHLIAGRDPDLTLQATADSETDDVDYYCFDTEDDFSVIGEREHILVELSHVPPEVDLDLYLYPDTAACTADEPIGSSTAFGSADERIDWIEGLGDDNSGRYVVAVRRYFAASCALPYTLHIRGLE